MSATIDSIVGWDFNRRLVAAKGIDGEVYHGDPELVAELASDPYITGEPALLAKKACIHAMINHADWNWRHFEVESLLLYEDRVRSTTKQRIGF